MVLRRLAALALLVPATASAAVSPDQLRRHVEMLASDEYEGRAPGTAGEDKTIAYIADQLAAAGLEPAGTRSWLQPLDLVVRTPAASRARWKSPNGPAIDVERLILVGRGANERIGAAPVVFAGHGAVLPQHGIDQLAGAELRGAIVLILYEPPEMPDFPSFADRVTAVAERGAAAVIGIISDSIPWEAVEDIYRMPRTSLAVDRPAPVQGLIAQEAAERIAAAAGTNLGRLLNGASGPAFTARALRVRGSLQVGTKIETIRSHNVVGRLRGSGGGGESVLYLGHWDHFGICRPSAAQDRICNGAVDNASGVATLIEIARGLAAGPRPKRDVIFLATTAEEVGLHGADYFARYPIVPLRSIVAALNLDMNALARKGAKVSVIGRGIAPLDATIDAAAREQGRAVDDEGEADRFLERQDGWPLRRRGVPAVLAGGAFSDMELVSRFLLSRYHRPDDELAGEISLDGAAQDADLLLALGRRLADPDLYRPPPALARP